MTLQKIWIGTETLLEHLERIEAADVYEEAETRFSVQTVIRPKTDAFHDFRGYAGKLYGGDLSVGDEILVLPSKKESKVKEIYFFDQTFETAKRGSSINLTLTDDVIISRGDIIVKKEELPEEKKQIEAKICWMDDAPFKVAKKYKIQLGVRTELVKVSQIKAEIKTDFSGQNEGVTELTMNQIGLAELKLAKPIFVDQYNKNKATGSFIIIDPQTNNTSGVGFIQ